VRDDQQPPRRYNVVQVPLGLTHPYIPEAYLDDAANALRNCGNPAVRYDRLKASGIRADPPPEILAAQAAHGVIRQMTAGVLFSALAAEAYVNRFLAQNLPKPDFAAVDRLRTVDKYVIAVSRADPEITFPRDAWPVGRLTQLFAIRNALVHHKPEKPPKDEITPLLLAEFVIAVAEAARRLGGAREHQDVRPLLITKDAEHLREWAHMCMQGPPPLAGEGSHPPDLMLTAFRRHFGDELDRHVSEHVAPAGPAA
jgi:hypothetical protein